MTYADQLQTDEWRLKRMRIIQKAGFRCEECHAPFPGGNGLEVHHCAYITGRKAWEYPEELLMPLCRDCHEFRQGRQDAAFIQLGKAMRAMTKLELDSAVWNFLATAYLKPFIRSGTEVPL